MNSALSTLSSEPGCDTSEVDLTPPSSDTDTQREAETDSILDLRKLLWTVDLTSNCSLIKLGTYTLDSLTAVADQLSVGCLLLTHAVCPLYGGGAGLSPEFPSILVGLCTKHFKYPEMMFSTVEMLDFDKSLNLYSKNV